MAISGFSYVNKSRMFIHTPSFSFEKTSTIRPQRYCKYVARISGGKKLGSISGLEALEAGGETKRIELYKPSTDNAPATDARGSLQLSSHVSQTPHFTPLRAACVSLACISLLGSVLSDSAWAMDVSDMYQENKMENTVIAAEGEMRLLQSGAAGGGRKEARLLELERQIKDLRMTEEEAAKMRLEMLRMQGEQEAREGQSRDNLLCATPFGVDVVGITQTIGLLGALVGGVAARQSKMEVEALNDKLRAVNSTLRKQARSGITYAPGLTYAPALQPVAPPGGEAEELTEKMAAEMLNNEDKIDGPVCVLDEIRMVLKSGKALLADPADPGAAMVQFKKALMLAKIQGNRLQERRAIRGLAAAKKLQGDIKGSLADYMKVLQISQEVKDYAGDTDALGIVADLYTELGEFEQAGKYYDIYIDQLNYDEEDST